MSSPVPGRAPGRRDGESGGLARCLPAGMAVERGCGVKAGLRGGGLTLLCLLVVTGPR